MILDAADLQTTDGQNSNVLTKTVYRVLRYMAIRGATACLFVTSNTDTNCHSAEVIGLMT